MSEVLEMVQTMLLLNDSNNIHESFLRKYLPDLVDFSPKISNPYLIFKIQSFLEKKLNLPAIEKKFCTHPYLFLLMQAPDQLHWLEKILGALYCIKEIKKVIDRPKKRELLDFLGEELYSFVIKQGGLYVPFIAKINITLEQDISITTIENTGHFLLEYLWCHQPDCLMQRFILRFDAAKIWDFRHVIDCDLQDQLLNLCRRLLRQKEKAGLC